MFANLYLKGIPAKQTVGIFAGSSGTTGYGFSGFSNIPLGSVILLRTSSSHARLIHADRPSLFRNWNDGDLFVLQDAEHIDDRGLIDAQLSPCWCVQADHVLRMELTFDKELSEETFPSIDLVQFKKSFASDDFFLSAFHLAFASFICVSSVEAFDAWKCMLRILEGYSSVVPVGYIRALALHINEMPEDCFEDSARLETDLCRVVARLLLDLTDFREDCAKLHRAAAERISGFEKIAKHIEEDDEQDAPMVVDTNAVLPLPASNDSKPRLESRQANAVSRMDWML